MCQHFLFFYCVLTFHRTEQTVSEVIFTILITQLLPPLSASTASLSSDSSMLLPAFSLQLEVVEMDCLRLPGTSPDLHHTVYNISDSLYYYIWSHPLAMELVCFTWLQLWIVSHSLIVYIFLTVLNYFEVLPHITVCSFQVILKACYKLRVTALIAN